MIFLIDFDKTISKQCSCATMIENFAIADTSDLDEQWERGELSTPVAMNLLLEILDMNEKSLFRAMKDVEIDPYFDQFLSYCEQQKHQFAVVSDGFSSIISYILMNHAIIGDHRTIPIYSNILEYRDTKWYTSFPYHSNNSPNLGVCKSDIVKKYQQESSVAFIGDGYTDYQAAIVSDYVFAKDKLATFCENQAIPHFKYDNFNDIITTCMASKLK